MSYHKGKRKLNVVLDLDNTIIHSLTPAEYKKLLSDGKIDKNKYKHLYLEHEFVVMLRPHLKEFFRYLFDNHNVSVWTYGNKDYALWIIDKVIKPLMKSTDKLKYILFEYHAEASEKRYKGKKKRLKMLCELSKLDQNTTVLLDDLNENCEGQKSINVESFDLLNNEKLDDNYLLKVITKLELMKT